MSPCDYCGDSESLVQEEEGLICSKCGAISQPNAISWEKEENPAGGTNVSAFEIKHQITDVSGFNHSYKFCERGSTFIRKDSLKQKVFDFLKTICANAHIPEHIKKRSEELLHKAYQLPYFVKKTAATKMVLAGVCIYWHLREEQLPITMRTMASLTQCKLASFGCVYDELKTLLHVGQQPGCTTESYAESFCHSHNLSSSVKKILLDLIPIYKEASTQTVCVQENAIVPLAYVSYMACNYFEKPSMTFSQFCKVHKIKETRRTSLTRHCAVTLRMLAVMCESLPWVDEVQDSSSGRPQVWFHIEDLIKHKRSVLNEVSTAPLDDSNCGGLKRKADIVEKIDDVGKTYVPKKRRRPDESETEEVKFTHDLDSQLLLDEDMTEEELSQLIRSDEEVLQLKNSIASDQ